MEHKHVGNNQEQELKKMLKRTFINVSEIVMFQEV